MEGLLKQLSFYGPILVRRYNNAYWHVYCEVRLFEHSDIKLTAQSTGPDLYSTLRELLRQSAVTKKKLIDKQKEPKQEKLNYGSQNTDWNKIT